MQASHFLVLVAGVGTDLPRAVIEAVVEVARARADGGPAAILAPGCAVEIPLARAVAPEGIRPALEGAPIDVLVVTAVARRKSLLVADMDSTIVTGETLDELAALAGSGARVAEITARSMNGELDFAAALRARVATLAGKSATLLEETWRGVALMPGARSLVATMRRHGAATALVSGGFTFFTDRVAAACGFDEAHANVLHVADGVLAGTVAEPILDRGAKRATLERLARARGIAREATLAVGDGANDLDMLRAAGLGIAFRPKPVLAAAVPNRVVHADLRALLYAQGYRADEIVDSTPAS